MMIMWPAGKCRWREGNSAKTLGEESRVNWKGAATAANQRHGSGCLIS